MSGPTVAEASMPPTLVPPQGDSAAEPCDADSGSLKPSLLWHPAPLPPRGSLLRLRSMGADAEGHPSSSTPCVPISSPESVSRGAQPATFIIEVSAQYHLFTGPTIDPRLYPTPERVREEKHSWKRYGIKRHCSKHRRACDTIGTVRCHRTGTSGRRNALGKGLDFPLSLNPELAYQGPGRSPLLFWVQTALE